MFVRRYVKKNSPSDSKETEKPGSPDKKAKRSNFQKQRGFRRFDVIISGTQSAFQSPLIFFIILLVLSSVMSVLNEIPYVLLIPMIVAAVRFRRLAFEFFLLVHVIENSLGLWPWYSLVDDDLYLGAIPIFPEHREMLADKLKISAVLSVVQDFELTSSTFVGTPVSADEWKRMDISQKQLSCPDWLPPPLKLMDEGADFLNSYLAERKKVYIHCKSGVGRSASVVGAYFVKYKRMSAVEAQRELSVRRPAVFKENSAQMKNLVAYEEFVRSQKTF